MINFPLTFLRWGFLFTFASSLKNFAKMSYTEIYRFTSGGAAKKFAEIPNAFRGAMAIWRELESRYLSKYIPPWVDASTNRSYSRVHDIFGVGLKEIWALCNSPKLTRNEKIVLLSTFDNAIVLRKDIPELLVAFNEFGGVTSLSEQAKEIESLLDADNKFIAIAWNQTSVNADVWQPYNMHKQTNHWNVFDELKKSEVNTTP